MFEGGGVFFLEIGDIDIQALCDLCFDLAYTFRQDPMVFLQKPVRDLPFWVKNANRLHKRINKKG